MTKAITNPGKDPMYVAGRYIAPGETRHFEDHEVPPHQRHLAVGTSTSKAGQQEAKKTEEITKPRKVAEVISILPDLSDEDLALLEQNDSRKGVQEGIAAERLVRAASKEIDEFVASLGTMSDLELEDILEAFKEDEGRLALIQEEITKRKGGSQE